MGSDSENDRMLVIPEGDIEVPTTAYITYMVADARDREIEHLTSTYLARVPGLRKLLPAIKNAILKRDITDLLDVYDELEILQNFPTGSRLLAEFLITRAVDNFQCYLAEVLATVFRARRETLRSFEKVKAEDVLACASIEEFILRMADSKAEELSYGGVKKMTTFMTNELRLAISETEDCIPRATEAIAIRNVIVHNRGKVNEHFVQMTGCKDLKKGDTVPIDLERAEVWRASLDEYAKLIDRAVMAKFGDHINRHEFKSLG